jgi:hypothetical protein
MTFTNGIQTKGAKQGGLVLPLSQDLVLLPIPLLSIFTNREASDGTTSSSVPRSKEQRNLKCLTTLSIFCCYSVILQVSVRLYKFMAHLF